jgi:hypothetical protein
LKENQINDLKETIVQCEIKNRRLLEQLNQQINKEAQNNVEQTMELMMKRFGPGKD